VMVQWGQDNGIVFLTDVPEIIPQIEIFVILFFRFLLVMTVVYFFWHMTLFTVWLDIKNKVLGGKIASVIPPEEKKGATVT